MLVLLANHLWNCYYQATDTRHIDASWRPVGLWLRSADDGFQDEQGHVQAHDAEAYSDAEIHTRLCEQGNLRGGKLELVALAAMHSIKTL